MIPETRATADVIEAIAKKAQAKPKKTASAEKRKANKIQGIIQQASMDEQLLRQANKFRCIQSTDEFLQYIESIKKNGIAAIDTETTGLNPMADEVVGICLFTPNEKAIYVPLKHIDSDGNIIAEQIPVGVVADALNSLDGIKWILHNAKFDIRFLRHSMGIRIKAHFDTSLAGNYLNENEPHKLKALHAKYIEGADAGGNYSDYFEDMGFNHVPIDLAYLYAAGDALKTFELYQFQEPFLNPKKDECISRGLQDAAEFFHQTEVPLIDVIADIEDCGVALDVSYAERLAIEYNGQIEQIKHDCLDMISKLDLSGLEAEKSAKLSTPVNLGSPLQLSIIIYDVMGFKPVDKEKPRGTGAEILEALTESKKHGQFFKSLLKYRELSKLLSTYIEKLPKVVNERTGKIHASFNQFGAKTGRFSSSEPNLQNIPASDKNIRKMFVAKHGNVFISCDYSQQEPRVLAHVADDDKMIEAYATGKDLYSWIASEVYGKPYDDCKEFFPDGSKNDEGKKMRNSMKSVVLGLMYGRGANAIAEQLNISKNEAKRIIDMFFDSFEKVAQYIHRTKHNAKRFGFVQTAYGRKRRLPDIQLTQYQFERFNGQSLQDAEADYFTRQLNTCRWDEKEQVKAGIQSQYGVRVIDNGGKIAEAERQSVNSVIQGSSADITKLAMLAIANDEQMKQWRADIILTVHDEIIVECPAEHQEEASERMQELMIDAARAKIKVPMKVDVAISEKWNA
jgi:DNA polymerase I-like protein with 3'-5' exonuclease and polymerase domains